MAKIAMPTALLKAATLEARIVEAVKSRSHMQAEEHELLFQAVMHAKEHGDTTFIAKMINDMPNGSRVEAMAEWVKAHFPIEGRTDKNDKGEKLKNIHGRAKLVFKLKKDRKPDDWKMEKAWDTPFYDFTKPKVEAVFDVDSLVMVLDRYVKRGEQAVAEGKFKGSKEEFLAHKEQVFQFKRAISKAEVKNTEVQAAA